MHYDFSPNERLLNILAVLDALQKLHADSDTAACGMWQREIERQLGNLNDAVMDMRPVPTTGADGET